MHSDSPFIPGPFYPGFNPSEKYESQLGWFFPIYGNTKFMFQTTTRFYPFSQLLRYVNSIHLAIDRAAFSVARHSLLVLFSFSLSEAKGWIHGLKAPALGDLGWTWEDLPWFFFGNLSHLFRLFHWFNLLLDIDDIDDINKRNQDFSDFMFTHSMVTRKSTSSCWPCWQVLWFQSISGQLSWSHGQFRSRFERENCWVPDDSQDAMNLE